jgi:hypothetical protein
LSFINSEAYFSSFSSLLTILKAHGTTATGVQKDLRWNCDQNTADRFFLIIYIYI